MGRYGMILDATGWPLPNRRLCVNLHGGRPEHSGDDAQRTKGEAHGGRTWDGGERRLPARGRGRLVAAQKSASAEGAAGVRLGGAAQPAE
jgi:hypothetical protein